MKKTFDVKGMTCAACQAHVNDAVCKLDGIISCNVNLLKNNMIVEYDESICNDSNIINAVLDAGYSANLKDSNDIRIEKDHLLRDLIISIVFLFILMYFSMGVMLWHFPIFKVFDMKKCPMGFSLIQFIIVLPIIYINRKYFINGFKRLFKGPTMDSLIAIGATASLIYGIYCLFMIALGYNEYHMYLYFESAGMILVFVSIGKYLEFISKRKTTRAIESLMDLAPKRAIIYRDNKEIEINSSDVEIEDIVICKNGSIIPIDGIIIEGNSGINEATITGESIPKEKTIGDNVYSGTLVTNGYIKVKALRVGNDTTIATIIRLVDEASNSKAPISKLADRISRIFVPTIFIIALITFIANIIYVRFNNRFDDNMLEIALNFSITTIVIACPCALGLATPVAIMVSSGVGARNGLLVKNAQILENASKIKTILLDKTGTITCGQPEVIDFVKYCDDDIESILYNIESMSEHPLSKSIIKYTSQNSIPKNVDNFESIPGVGIKGSIDNILYIIGNRSILSDENELSTFDSFDNNGNTVVAVKKNDKLVAILTIRDRIKPSSKRAISLLKNMGIDIVMITGDNLSVASSVASEVGIDNIEANILPQDKGNIVDKYKRSGMVAMVGDGVNDSIALAKADIGISMGNASDIAKDSSDIVLVKNDLLDLVNVIRLSKRTLNTIRLGLFWAFFYNFICVILSTGIFYYISDGKFKMSPMYGAIAMSISSVSVVLNALTIGLFKGYKEEKNNMELVIKVEGMMCMHCVAHIEEACKKASGVTGAVANLKKKNVTVTYEGTVDKNQIINNINAAGYKVVE